MPSTDQFDLVRRLGVQVIEVPDRLPHPIVWVEDMGLAFVSRAFSPCQVEAAADELLSAAFLAVPAPKSS